MGKLLFLFFASVFAISLASDDGTLVCLQFIHRHGDRAPIKPYPKDPYSDEKKYWPNGWGQLTETGLARMKDLGIWINNEYEGFPSEKYHYELLLSQSTDVERAIMSGIQVLAGWYPKHIPHLERKYVAGQVIPIHTKSGDAELTMSKPCPRYNQLYDETLVKQKPQLDRYQPSLDQAAVFGGYNDSSEAFNVIDALIVHSQSGLPISPKAKTFFPDPLNHYRDLYFRMACLTKPLQRLKCGPLLKEMINYFDQCAIKNTTYKAKHYSAHDTTLTNLNQCLGFVPPTTAPYAATIFFELREKFGKLIVVVKYKADNEVTRVDIPGCDRPCTLNKFRRALQDVIPDDWERECQL